MRQRVLPVLAVLAGAVCSLVVAAAPASAVNTPPPAVCVSTSSCLVELNYDVTYTGSSGGDNGVAITPPPCIGLAIGDAHTGSQAILSLYGDTAPVPPSPSPSPASPSPAPTAATPTAATPTAATPSAAPPPAPPVLTGAQQQILSEAKTLYASNPATPGEWYQIDKDPAASAAAQQRCLTLPAYLWVPGGSDILRVDGLNIPPETLAELAYNQLSTAQLGQVSLDPQGKSDTNLPTFFDAALLPPARGVLSVTREGIPYVWATAATPDGESATVWAWVTGLSISPGTPDATTWNQQRCVVAHPGDDGHTFVLGSRYTEQEMAAVGAGQQIDCGVTYTAPGTYALTASVTWNACWSLGLATAGGPPAGCKPVPGAGGLGASTSAPVRVAVREIQSVNS